jgi:hypothetical protein
VDFREKGFYSSYTPPQKVSLVRYRIGLVMICVPILVGWLGPYFSEFVFEAESLDMYIFIAGDLLFVSGCSCFGANFGISYMPYFDIMQT